MENKLTKFDRDWAAEEAARAQELAQIIKRLAEGISDRLEFLRHPLNGSTLATV